MSTSGAGDFVLASKPLPNPWLVVACASVGAFIVYIFGLDPSTGVGLLTLGLSLVLLAVRIEVLIYTIIGFTVVLVDGWLITRRPEDVPFRFGLGRLYLMEIPIYLAFLGFLIRVWTAKKHVTLRRVLAPTPLDLPLRLWLIAFPIFAVYGLLLGHPLKDAIGYFEWRCLFIAILLYFLVTSLFQQQRDVHRLWDFFFLIVLIKACYSLFLAVSGIDPPLPLVFGQGPVGEGPENVMYLFAALPALAVALFHLEKTPRERFLLLFGSAVMIANVVLSQKRDPQVALLIGLVVLAWHLPRREKIRWGLRLACLALVIGISGFVTSLTSSRSGVGASVSRYTDIIDFIQSPTANPAEGSTFGFHLFDMIDGWEKIKERPVFGQGFGGQTERNLTMLPIAWGGDIETGMIHNQYLTYWLKMGITGLILFVWLVAAFLWACHRGVPGVPQTYGLAVTLGFAAAMWAEMAMEVMTAGWMGNTKTPITVFLAMALSIGFLRMDKSYAA